MTHSDSVHTGCCCCHRTFMQFDEIKNELQNVRQMVGVAVTLLSVSIKVICCETPLLAIAKLRHADTQRVQSSEFYGTDVFDTGVL